MRITIWQKFGLALIGSLVTLLICSFALNVYLFNQSYLVHINKVEPIDERDVK